MFNCSFRPVLLGTAATIAIGLAATPARADPTAPCNVALGADGIPDTSDDGLECGSNSIATTDATAIGNSAVANSAKGVAVGDTATIDIAAAGGVAVGSTSYVGQGPGIAVGSGARSTAPSAMRSR